MQAADVPISAHFLIVYQAIIWRLWGGVTGMEVYETEAFQKKLQAHTVHV